MDISRSLAALLVVLAPHAFAAPPPVTITPFISGLASPVEVAHANDGSGRLFVVEQAGRIRVIRNGALLPAPFLDITPGNGGPVRSGGEQGLLGLAFHPSYQLNGRFFVFYTRTLPGDAVGSEIVVARYTRSAGNADVADAASASIVIVIPHPQQGNHNGGKIAFGADGYLYVAVGDGGGSGDPFNAGQALTDLRGKILRLDVDGPSGYAIPASNPFVGAGSGARGEIWAYGLRNPWKFSFDRATGDLFIGDVGQGLWEEIDFEPRGAAGGSNYGWKVYEGAHCFSPASGCSLAGHVPPIIEYPHNGTTGGFSVTGGYRYRGTGQPALAGFYLYGDYVSGRIWAAEQGVGGAWTATQVASFANPSTFGEDEYGELYVASLTNGTLQRVTPAAAPAGTGSRITRYRLYHAGTLDHLYTTDFNEYTVLPGLGWIAEGAIYQMFNGVGSAGGITAVPNYRLYNPASQQHHWTTDANEYAVLPSHGWVQEGIDGHLLPSAASGALPLYRLYLPAAGGLHLWTTDANERHVLSTQRGWIAEGVAGYVIPLP